MPILSSFFTKLLPKPLSHPGIQKKPISIYISCIFLKGDLNSNVIIARPGDDSSMLSVNFLIGNTLCINLK